MPVRKVSFANGEFYHIYNRGVNRRKIFLTQEDYARFLESMNFYVFSDHKMSFSNYNKFSHRSKEEYFGHLNTKLIEILSFAFMPNHFHLLVRQTQTNGISNFVSLLQNSYTRYFNLKHERVGHLFQGQFKVVSIKTNEQLLHVSRYIHLNPLTSGVVKHFENLENYPWTSFPLHLSLFAKEEMTAELYPILGQFNTSQYYKKFVHDQAAYQQELDFIKHLTLE